MQIGQLAGQTDTKVTTIRFYEEIGLLAVPARTAAGRRTYGTSDVERLRFIRNSRRLGFSLDEIRSLLRLAEHPDRDCSEAAHIAATHLAAVEERIAQLTGLRDELVATGGSSCSAGRASQCKIIQALAGPNPLSV